MAWPKGWNRAQVAALSEEQRKELFKTGKLETTGTPTEVNSDLAKVASPQSIPVNLFSGDRKRFEVMGKNGSFTDPIPGYRLYAFKDSGGGMRISQALASGWQFVDKEEVVLNDSWNTPLDTDLGSKVRIPAEQNDEAGKPVYHYLMKKPLWLDAEHQKERERLHDQIDQSLRAGTFNMTPGERRYTAEHPPIGSPSGLPPISISSKLGR
jgi:hypothetical protein